MNAPSDKKLTIPTLADKKPTATTITENSAKPALDEKSSTDKLREAIAELDAERTALVKITIENIKPGKPFDSSKIREINKLEVKKNRLIVSFFASMLRKNADGIQPIVHQIINL